jgi:rod shape-determining protein MreD
VHRFITARLLILAGALLILQYSFSPFSLLWKGRPDFLYLLVLDYAFFWSWERVPFFALGMGLLRDFIGGHLFGIETLSLTVTGLALYFGVRKLDRDSLWVKLGISILFVGLTETLSLGLSGWLETSKSSSWELIGSVFWTTIYTSALAPGFFWVTNRWFKRRSILKQYDLFR